MKKQKKSYAELYQLFADHEDILSEFQNRVYRDGVFSGFRLGIVTANGIVCAYSLLELYKNNKEKREILNKMRKES